MEKETIERYLKHFDSIFGTKTIKNLNLNKVPLLKILFEHFEEDLYTPSQRYKELRRKRIELSDKLESSFTQEQQELFEQYWEIDNQILVEEEQQLFLFGYLVANELKYEIENL